MKIQIDLNVNIPQPVIDLITAAFSGATAATTSTSASLKGATAAENKKPVTETKPQPAAPAPAPTPTAPEMRAEDVTDNMILSAVDAAMPAVNFVQAAIKDAIAANFVKADGSPATLNTVRPDQRARLLKLLHGIAQTGNVADAVAAL